MAASAARPAARGAGSAEDETAAAARLDEETARAVALAGALRGASEQLDCVSATLERVLARAAEAQEQADNWAHVWALAGEVRGISRVAVPRKDAPGKRERDEAAEPAAGKLEAKRTRPTAVRSSSLR
jgi:hypothetical protein